jgi:hypothetical protein
MKSAFHNAEATMRMMLKFTIPVEKGNAALKDGSLAKAMESIMSHLKPEAAYFGVSNGLRGGMIFFDMAGASQVVEIVEPFFLSFDAAVELIPVMTGEDLRKGLAKAAEK